MADNESPSQRQARALRDRARRLNRPAPTLLGRDPARGIMTHAEIARVMGLTRQAVEKIERRALWKLRRNRKLRELHEE